MEQNTSPSGLQTEKNAQSPIRRLLSRLAAIREFNVLAVVIILGVLISLRSPYFFTISNIMGIIKSLSTTTIMAIGMTIVIIAGGIDLSVGSVMGMAGMLTAISFENGLPAILCVLVGLLSGVVCGLFNGLLITKINLPPFIATLGTLSICRGLLYVITRGFPKTPPLPPAYVFLGQGYVFGVVPVPVVIMAVLIVVFTVIMKKTKFGRYVYALGGNEVASRLSGVRTDFVKMMAYVLSGLLSGIAGVILFARMTSAESAAGLGEEMDVIAATVIGGASMSGGVGSVVGTLIGSTLIGIINNGIVLLGINTYAQQSITGIVILLAVGIDMIRVKRK